MKHKDGGLFVLILFLVLLSLTCSANRAVSVSKSLPAAPFKPSKQNIKNIHTLFEAAESFYKVHKYDSAAFYFLHVYKKVPQLVNSSENYFKLAYSYFKIGEIDSAVLWFKKSVENKDFPLKDYACFFLAMCYEQKGKNELAATLFHHVSETSVNPFLVNQSLFSTLLIQQDTSFQSLEIINSIKEKYLEDTRETYVKTKIRLLNNFRRRLELFDYLVQVGKEDWHPDVDTLIFTGLDSLSDVVNFERRITLIKTLINSGRKEQASFFINKFWNDSDIQDKDKTILAFYKGLILYRNKKYNSASKLFGSLSLSDLPDKLKAERMLHLARCQARLGFLNSAIKKYYAFQKMYPNHDKAGDALWWIALTFEQRNDFKNAKKYYQILANKFPKREVGKEARLRIIFNQIKNKHYKTALKSIRKIYRKLSYDDKLRMTYWKYRCYMALGKINDAEKEKQKLLNDPFQNFFTIKMFLRENKDSLSILKNFSPYEPPTIMDVEDDDLQHLERVTLVANLLNKKYAKTELKRLLSVNRKNKNFRLFLAEINEKLGNWSDAFWLFRRNYEAYFMRKNWKSKIGYIKKLYPLYYDSLVFKYATHNSIDPMLVYALMKRESLFQHDVRSYANAYGLMQILPSTAKRLNRTLADKKYKVPLDLFNPEINIELGTRYLGMLVRDFNAHLPYVIASYNAGEHRVKKWEKRYDSGDDPDLFIELIPIDQTRKYVKFVLYYYYVYQWFYKNDSNIAWFQMQTTF